MTTDTKAGTSLDRFLASRPKKLASMTVGVWGRGIQYDMTKTLDTEPQGHPPATKTRAVRTSSAALWRLVKSQ